MARILSQRRSGEEITLSPGASINPRRIRCEKRRRRRPCRVLIRGGAPCQEQKRNRAGHRSESSGAAAFRRGSAAGGPRASIAAGVGYRWPPLLGGSAGWARGSGMIPFQESRRPAVMDRAPREKGSCPKEETGRNWTSKETERNWTSTNP